MSSALEGVTAFLMAISSLVTAALGLRTALTQAAVTAAHDALVAKHVAERVADELDDDDAAG